MWNQCMFPEVWQVITADLIGLTLTARVCFDPLAASEYCCVSCSLYALDWLIIRVQKYLATFQKPQTSKNEGIGLLLDIKSLMDLRQSPSCTTPSLLHFPYLKSIIFPSHLRHPSVHPCFPCFILHPCIPVSLISVPLPPWSSCPLHIVFLPCFLFSLFHASTFVPSPWLSQADPAA